MSQALNLGGSSNAGTPRIRRLNRLPIIVAILLVVLFFAVIFYGLSSRGLRFGSDDPGFTPGSRPASTHADQLTQGVPDGIIGEPARPELPPAPARPPEPAINPFMPRPPASIAPEPQQPLLQPEDEWRARLEREQEEQLLRELHRQRMASLQASDAAFDSPIAIDLGSVAAQDPRETTSASASQSVLPRPSALDLYASAMQAGTGGGPDANEQRAKESFFNQDIGDLGYLPNTVVGPFSPYELKRGSVIPATLVTGINSDLPGRITAQVSQNVFDSATGRHVLIPQGSRLLGRYDSKVTFGQNRVLVIWSDIIFPNGATLQIGGMAGADAAGHSGFHDRVDNHYLRSFGSAILVALIGAGTEMMLPQDRNSFGTVNGAQDAARRSFTEAFGQFSQQTVSRHLNIQPTLNIRPGYRFNILVDQDIQFAGPYGD